MRIDIFEDGISYVTNEVSTIPTNLANANEENRQKFVTDLAAVSRGKNESSNPSKRYEHLLKEAALETASRPLEFLPIILNCRLENSFVYIGNKRFNFEVFNNKLGRFSYMYLNLLDINKNMNFMIFKLYTNMRAVVNSKLLDYEEIPYMQEEEKSLYKMFKAIKLKIPMFIWAQWPMTHTMLSKESQSDRVSKANDYWLPRDIEERYYNAVRELENNDKPNKELIEETQLAIKEFKDKDINSNKSFREFFKEYMLNYLTQDKVQKLLEYLNYKQEIWSRSPYYFKYKEVIVTGWYNDPSTWKHSFIERSVEPELWKNWTQKETKTVLNAVKTIITSET